MAQEEFKDNFVYKKYLKITKSFRKKRPIWKMGLPMIISMVLQALYNVIDSVFVANIKGTGALANEALT